ncbi:bifunctional pyr operon transcriptional regulator/uracil phosphoribosyltransferase PyrR [Williamsoniiplasma lucivorax]|uniref:Bifunctional protein PyrR n=1 Tax=Williamsoniiplasma lucivorax TaxID=209274 RepID=A0A2S5R9Y1_9MOLU|nr:bifunctional pyr operon transcriptional regulator/uracil phosphoribosyltransferase PyrR [Williamsoniiplasma lucivorax]PPE04136.1 pyrimidine operon attenuation protein / uracil phosphoribosyltransferase [Williamsoniiplasma lucivorax]
MNKTLLDQQAIQRAISRMCHEIIESAKGTTDLVLAGIKTNGIFIAQRIAEKIAQIENVKIPVIELDISDFRDDMRKTSNNFTIAKNLNNLKVVIVDDVLFTGRTVRAALDCILTNYRPQKIALAVLVDRGHRELPIRADFVGKNIPTSFNERVEVQLSEIDNQDLIQIVSD